MSSSVAQQHFTELGVVVEEGGWLHNTQLVFGLLLLGSSFFKKLDLLPKKYLK